MWVDAALRHLLPITICQMISYLHSLSSLLWAPMNSIWMSPNIHKSSRLILGISTDWNLFKNKPCISRQMSNSTSVPRQESPHWNKPYIQCNPSRKATSEWWMRLALTGEEVSLPPQRVRRSGRSWSRGSWPQSAACLSLWHGTCYGSSCL